MYYPPHWVILKIKLHKQYKSPLAKQMLTWCSMNIGKRSVASPAVGISLNPHFWNLPLASYWNPLKFVRLKPNDQCALCPFNSDKWRRKSPGDHFCLLSVFSNLFSWSTLNISHRIFHWPVYFLHICFGGTFLSLFQRGEKEGWWTYQTREAESTKALKPSPPPSLPYSWEVVLSWQIDFYLWFYLNPLNPASPVDLVLMSLHDHPLVVIASYMSSSQWVIVCLWDPLSNVYSSTRLWVPWGQ